MIKKICEYCGNEFYVIPCRESIAKYCSRKCADLSKKAKPNVVCDICGKHFHMKKHQLERYERNLGIFCSVECLNKAKEIKYRGDGNHQFGLRGHLNSSFKGDEIIIKNHKINDILVYVPEHPYADSHGRVKKHRLIIEQNYNLFDTKYFENIDGKVILKKEICVHHLDGNHDNNDISNLVPCTKVEHKKYHPSNIIERDSLGRIIKIINKTAVVKQGELLGSLEEGNQQPS